MRTAVAVGSNVRNAVAAARRKLDLSLSESREVCRSGDEDGLYRVTLASGDVVEVSVIQHSPAYVEDIIS
jgi:hypothetical protein